MTVPDTSSLDAEEIAKGVVGAIYVATAAIVGAIATGAAAGGVIVGIIGWVGSAFPAVVISGALLGVSMSLSVTEFLLRRRIKKAMRS